MSERKAVIKNADMSEDMQQDAVDCASQALEKPGRPALRANVEFYKGAVFHALGIPSDFFTAMFAMARTYGYIAHALEFRPQARLIRPRARYTPTAVGHGNAA